MTFSKQKNHKIVNKQEYDELIDKETYKEFYEILASQQQKVITKPLKEENSLFNLGKFRSEFFYSTVGQLENKIILDVGCGEGYFSLEMAKKGANIVGIDISEKMIEKCKKKKQQNPTLNINFVSCSAENTPYKNETFDIVVCLELLEHVLNPNLLMKEISRVLKPEGMLFLGTPRKQTMIEKIIGYLFYFIFDFEQVRKFINKNKLSDISIKSCGLRITDEELVKELKRLKLPDNFSEHLREYNNNDIKKLLESHGFIIKNFSGSPPFYWQIRKNKTIMSLYKKIFKSTSSKFLYRFGEGMYVIAMKK